MSVTGYRSGHISIYDARDAWDNFWDGDWNDDGDSYDEVSNVLNIGAGVAAGVATYGSATGNAPLAIGAGGVSVVMWAGSGIAGLLDDYPTSQ